MTVNQVDAIVDAAILINATGILITKRVACEADEQIIGTLEMSIENLNHQIKALKNVITDIKQSKQ